MVSYFFAQLVQQSLCGTAYEDFLKQLFSVKGLDVLTFRWNMSEFISSACSEASEYYLTYFVGLLVLKYSRHFYVS
jgi:hypothetical protein